MTRGAKGRRRNGGGLSGFILLIALLCAVVFIVSAVTYAPLFPQYDKSASAVSDITPPHTSAPQHRQTEDGSIVPQPGWHIALYAVPPCSDTIYTLINEEGRYVINYDPATRNARWAAYILTRAEAGVKNVDRASGFVRDMRTKDGRPQPPETTRARATTADTWSHRPTATTTRRRTKPRS